MVHSGRCGHVFHWNWDQIVRDGVIFMPITVRFNQGREPITGMEAVRYLNFEENLPDYDINFNPGHNEKN